MIDPRVLADLPVRVEGLEIQDPALILFGSGWYLSIDCPWEGKVEGRGFSWEDEDIESGASLLVGQELESIVIGTNSDRFIFTAGEVSAVPDSDLDPWVISLPSGLGVGYLKR